MIEPIALALLLVTFLVAFAVTFRAKDKMIMYCRKCKHETVFKFIPEGWVCTKCR